MDGVIVDAFFGGEGPAQRTERSGLAIGSYEGGPRPKSVSNVGVSVARPVYRLDPSPLSQAVGASRGSSTAHRDLLEGARTSRQGV